MLQQVIEKDLSKNQMKDSVIFIGILFSAFLIVSNLTALKLTVIANLTFPAGLIFFPITYIFDDILTEVYGFRISRLIIWSALLANIIVAVGTWVTTYIPSSPVWNQQHAYEIIYHASPRIFIASMISYFFGEFSNSIILAKLKVFTRGKFLWLRVLFSTGIGVGIDTIIFMHIAFFGIVHYINLWNLIATTYLLKFAYEICVLPITYKVANYLKSKDQIDYYDYHTNFNPFSLKISE